MNNYKDNWDKNNTTQFKIKLNNNTDCDIIDWLKGLDNKQGTVKELIRTYSIKENERSASMTLENKLGITNSAELAKSEEQLTKKRAAELFESNILLDFEIGTYRGLQQIHEYLFQDVYDFAGKTRTVNISKGGFRFVPLMYLDAALGNISKMPQTTFDEIIKKYVEMNVAHPFMEGNGRSTRIWLDLMLKKNLKKCVDWSKINKKTYLDCMRESVVNSSKLNKLLKKALTNKINDRDVFMKGIDYSYYYEENE